MKLLSNFVYDFALLNNFFYKKVGKGADETNLCKIYYANITENNVLYPYTCWTQNFWQWANDCPSKEIKCHWNQNRKYQLQIKNELTFNNLNFNLKYLMRFYHFWMCNLDNIQDWALWAWNHNITISCRQTYQNYKGPPQRSLNSDFQSHFQCWSWKLIETFQKKI